MSAKLLARTGRSVRTVGRPWSPAGRGEWVVRTAQLCDVSRLAAAATFGLLALVETHQRETETAKTVWAVSDGAEWIQGFVDLHRPDAARLRNVPHALIYVAHAGQAGYGEGTTAFTRWFARQRQTWRHGKPGEMVAALQTVAAAAKRRGISHAMTTAQASLGYLAKQRDMLAYAWCDARSYPIGSGSVESANKLGVERRLNGAGMHWARRHVQPMGALRAIACSDPWPEAWPQMAQHLRHQTQQDRRQRQLARRQTKGPMPFGHVVARVAPCPRHCSGDPPEAYPAAVTVAQAHCSQGLARALSPAARPPVAALSHQLKGAQQTKMVAFAKR